MAKYSLKQIQQLITSVEQELSFTENNLYTYDKYLTIDSSKSITKTNVNNVLATYSELLDIYFYLRDYIKENNNTLGIDLKTSQIAKLEKNNQLLNSVVEIGTPKEQYCHVSQKSKFSEGVDMVYINDIRNIIKKNQRTIQSLKNSCNGINNQNMCEISKEFEEILKKYGLID